MKKIFIRQFSNIDIKLKRIIIKHNKKIFFKSIRFNGFFIALTFLTTSLHAYQIPSIPNGYEHLEPILRNYSKDPQYRFVLPEVQSLLIENSDLIKTFQEIEIADDFSPYIADYEGFKNSPIDQNVRIFFYDGSKLPIDHENRLTEGSCFYFFNFVFINNRLWSNYFVNLIQEIFSTLDQSIEKRRQNSSLKRNDNPIALAAVLLENIPNEDLQLYFSFDVEERNRIKELAIEVEEQREASLSDEEKSTQDYFLRRLTLFHELGHCDLNREHEERADSIMNQRVVADITNRIKYEYPHTTLDSLLNNFLIKELFIRRDTLFKQPGLFDSWLAKLGFDSASNENRTKTIQGTQRNIEDIEALIMTTNLYD